MTREFLGVGWHYPVEWTPQDGVKLAKNEQSIQQAIWIILNTAPGERVMRPEFGCGIHDYVFAPNDLRTTGLIRYAVEQALIRWEPRIELEQVTVETDRKRANVMLVTIDYRVRTTDSRFNLVYPFYLQREEPS